MTSNALPVRNRFVFFFPFLIGGVFFHPFVVNLSFFGRLALTLFMRSDLYSQGFYLHPAVFLFSAPFELGADA